MSLIVLPYEKMAIHGDPMPDGLDLVDQHMYQSLCLLYARYHRKEISRDFASAEKGKMLYRYHKDKEALESSKKMARWQVYLWHNIESAQSRFRRERTIEAAENLSLTLDGVVKNNVFEEGNEKQVDAVSDLQNLREENNDNGGHPVDAADAG